MAWINTLAAVIMVGTAIFNGNWTAAWFACAAAWFAWMVARV